MVGRKVRVGDGTKTKPKSVGRSGRSLDNLKKGIAALSGEEDLAAFAKGLSEEELDLLIYDGAESDVRQKALDKYVKKVKPIVLAAASDGKWKERKVQDGAAEVLISPSTKSFPQAPTVWVKALKSEKKVSLADEILSVKIGVVKEYLGQNFIDEHKLIETKTEEYGTVKFKLR